MTSMTRKMLHAGLIALGGAMGDIGMHLSAGEVSLTHAVLVGLAFGAFSRVLGAVLAITAEDSA